MTLQSTASMPHPQAMLSALAKRRTAAILLGVAIGIVAVDNAAAQPYPTRPIKIISPFGAGGTPDALGRVVAHQLAIRLGQNTAIENRTGGGLTLAPKAVASADPDGYTLLQASNALAYTSVLHPNAGYDPLKSFVPVATIASWSFLLVVPANLPAGTVQELIANAKANPGQVNIGFPVGGAPQVVAEMFKTASGAKFNGVPYRQNAQLVADHWQDGFIYSLAPGRGWRP